MARILGKQDIIEILYGAAFLSTGGGGPLATGLSMLEELAQEGQIALPLIDPAEMEDGTFAATAIGFGSPDAFSNAGFGMEAVYAFDKYAEMMQAEGTPIRYLCSLEFAGFNTFTPMYVAIRRGLGLLDIDLNGKAIMELSSSLSQLTGQRIYPMVLAAADGSTVVIDAGDRNNIAFGEQVMLEVAKLCDMRLGLSNNLLSKEEVLEKTVLRAISRAGRIGKILLECQKTGEDVLGALSSVLEVSRVCRGRLARIEMLERGKFNTGTLVIEEAGQEYNIDFQNEALAARRGGEVLITAPDMLCLLRADTLEPITCSEVEVGMELLIAATPADRKWNCPEAVAMYQPHLSRFFQGGPVGYGQR